MAPAAKSAQADASGVRPQDRSLRTRQQIISAGVYAFATRGFEATSIKAIAKRAGVSAAVVDFHFESKDDLWRASAEKIFGEFHMTFGTALETTAGYSARERAEALVTEAIVFFAQHPEFYRFITGESSGMRAEWLVTTHMRPLHQVFDALLADLDEDMTGEVPDRTHLFYMFVAAASAPYEMSLEFKMFNEQTPFDADAVGRHAESMIRTFLPPENR